MVMLAGTDDYLTRLSPVILNLESTGLTHLESEIRVEWNNCFIKYLNFKRLPVFHFPASLEFFFSVESSQNLLFSAILSEVLSAVTLHMNVKL